VLKPFLMASGVDAPTQDVWQHPLVLAELQKGVDTINLPGFASSR